MTEIRFSEGTWVATEFIIIVNLLSLLSKKMKIILLLALITIILRSTVASGKYFVHIHEISQVKVEDST